MSEVYDSLEETIESIGGGVPNAVKEFKNSWGKRIEELPEINYDDISKAVSGQSYVVDLPDYLLTPEGYIDLNGKIQSLKNNLLQYKILVDEHYLIRMKAIRNMQKIFARLSDGKNTQQREGDAEAWLSPHIMSTTKIEALKMRIDAKMDNLDSTALQLSRQLKSIEYGVKTGVLDASTMQDLQYDDYNNDSVWGDADE